jgi:fibronectin type 3 domain-containing protein
VSIPDDEAPGRPGAVRAQNEHGRGVRVAWNSSPSLDVATYRIRRKTGDKVEELGTCDTERLEIYDTAAVKGQTVMYAVTATDSAGNASGPTYSEKVLVRDFAGPPQVRFVAATLKDGAVEVRWERVVDFDLAGYIVCRSDLATGVFAKVNEKPVKELTLVDPKGTTELWYRVKAVDSSGNESLPSDPVAPVVVPAK